MVLVTLNLRKPAVAYPIYGLSPIGRLPRPVVRGEIERVEARWSNVNPTKNSGDNYVIDERVTVLSVM